MLHTHQHQLQQGHRRVSARSILAHFGFEFSNDYRLGSGHYSKVYKGYFKEAQRTFAIKVTDLESVSEMFKQKFLPRELEVWRELDHPNLVYLYKDFQWNNYQFAVMELVVGGDLLSYLQKNGHVNETTCRNWMLQIISALDYLHRKGIAHRDLKLENVLLCEDGIKVTDYGFTKQSSDLSSTFCGSRSYSSPEILLGTAYDMFKSDIWSLGVTGFIMLTNTMPFREDLPNLKIVDLQRKRRYKYPSCLNITKQCRTAIDALLTFQPGFRPNISECAKLEWFAQDSASLCCGGRRAGVGVMGQVRGR
ncbi:hypothetical protein niasHT_015537 [Heterodera trifolii]|uniref:Protein kinase domain-containing protein n=1 Tax=Heterodera trifolii TaxID=157864 RepID=A0ABD2L063_9BILA